MLKKGDKVVRWTLLEDLPEVLGTKKVKCVCDCGTERLVTAYNLANRASKSCGCLTRELAAERSRKYKVGKSHPLYSRWRGMREMCINPNHKNWEDYGERGITFCDRWGDFDLFLEDMEDSFEEGLTLDRVDNNGIYCKENCKWSTQSEQVANRRKNKGASSKYFGVSYNKNNSNWRSHTKVGDKMFNIGSFKNEIDAAIAYNNFIKKNGLNKRINEIEEVDYQ